jgi:large subunit ribosomal protein L22
MKGHLRHLRIAPRKVRLTGDLIKGKKAEEAVKLLDFTIKKAALPMKKLLISVIASAKQNFNKKPENLFVKKVVVNEGPKLKRWMPRARGRAYEIQKKSSHITIELGDVAEIKLKRKVQNEKQEETVKKDKNILTRIKNISKKIVKTKKSDLKKPKNNK